MYAGNSIGGGGSDSNRNLAQSQLLVARPCLDAIHWLVRTDTIGYGLLAAPYREPQLADTLAQPSVAIYGDSYNQGNTKRQTQLVDKDMGCMYIDIPHSWIFP